MFEMTLSFDWFWSLAVLTALEIVLGIDNIILISILVQRLPVEKRSSARRLGLGFALASRLLLLVSLVWLSRLTDPLFSVFNVEISIRDLVMILGGLFLMAKAVTEIFNYVEGEGAHEVEHIKTTNLPLKRLYVVIISQIILFDVIFSLDSVITAVGLAKELSVMVIAVIIAIVFMMIFANSIGRFVDQNPVIKILALSFLVMIGLLLVAEGFESHFDRGYVYFAMAFSLFIELLNKRRLKNLRKAGT